MSKAPIETKRTPLNDNPNIASVEKKYGISLPHLKVHYNSHKPKMFDANAFVCEDDIYLSTGCEDSLLHEIAHYIQQQLRMVRANKLFKGYAMNTDQFLEENAENMWKIGNKELLEYKMLPQPFFHERIVQMQRAHVPSIYTYLNTKPGNQLGIKVGPHTVAHTYLEFFVDHFDSKALFEEQIAPYDTNKVTEIVCQELSLSEKMTLAVIKKYKVAPKGEDPGLFKQISRYLVDYESFYSKAIDLINKGRSDPEETNEETNEKTNEETNEETNEKIDDVLFQLLNLNPYAVYSWGEGQTVSAENLKGKGESIIYPSLKLSYEAFDKLTVAASPKVIAHLIDDLSKFQNGEEANEFLMLRIKDIVPAEWEEDSEQDIPKKAIIDSLSFLGSTYYYKELLVLNKYILDIKNMSENSIDPTNITEDIESNYVMKIESLYFKIQNYDLDELNTETIQEIGRDLKEFFNFLDEHKIANTKIPSELKSIFNEANKVINENKASQFVVLVKEMIKSLKKQTPIFNTDRKMNDDLSNLYSAVIRYDFKAFGKEGYNLFYDVLKDIENIIGEIGKESSPEISVIFPKLKKYL